MALSERDIEKIYEFLSEDERKTIAEDSFSDFGFRVISWNAFGKTKTGMAALRRSIFLELLNRFPASVFLLQELPTQPSFFMRQLEKDTSLAGCYRIFSIGSSKEVAILINIGYWQATPLAVSEVLKPRAVVGYDRVDMLAQLTQRMVLVKLVGPRCSVVPVAQRRTLVVGSVHCNYNGITIQQRLAQAECIFEMLKQLERDTGTRCVVGGDFNVDLTETRPRFRPRFPALFHREKTVDWIALTDNATSALCVDLVDCGTIAVSPQRPQRDRCGCAAAERRRCSASGERSRPDTGAVLCTRHIGDTVAASAAAGAVVAAGGAAAD